MPVKRIPGNIFDSQASVLVVAVNTVGVMGAGLALEFRERHPDVYYHYKKACRQNKFRKEMLMLIKVPDCRYKVLAVPTKLHWKHNSTPELVYDNLKRVRAFLDDRKIDRIALPLLGAGLGKLDPDQVYSWIDELFSDHPSTVEVWGG